MLDGATEFPNVGSYALLLSPAPPAQHRQAGDPNQEEVTGPQLVRILRFNPQLSTDAFVSLPLREGASGNRTVPFSQIVDATPLSGAEGKEMCDLGRELKGQRVRDRATKQARFDALKQRAVYAPLLALQLRRLAEIKRSVAA